MHACIKKLNASLQPNPILWQILLENGELSSTCCLCLHLCLWPKFVDSLLQLLGISTKGTPQSFTKHGAELELAIQPKA